MCPESDSLDGRPAPANRRDRQRRRSLLAGKILLATDMVVDCAIRDISEAGAQIRLTCPMALPDSFRFIDVSRGRAFLATVMWRNFPLVGLHLTQPMDLTKLDAPADLHRLWLECAAR